MSNKFTVTRDFDKRLKLSVGPDLSAEAVAVIRMSDYKVMAVCPSMHEALTVAGALNGFVSPEPQKPGLISRKFIHDDADYDEMVTALGGFLSDRDEEKAEAINSMLQAYEAKRWPDQYSAIAEIGGVPN